MKKSILFIGIAAVAMLSGTAFAEAELAFKLDSNYTTPEGVTWDGANYTVSHTAFQTTGIQDYTNFSISFNATIGEFSGDYTELLVISDCGQNGTEGQFTTEFGVMRFVFSKKYQTPSNARISIEEPPPFGSIFSDVPAGQLAADCVEAASNTSVLSGLESNLVDDSLIYGDHRFTLVFADDDVTLYSSNADSEYNKLFESTFYPGVKEGDSFFEKITTSRFVDGELAGQLEYAGFKITFDSSISDIAFYNGDVTKTIPEPATATLSLLTLAGLAARRRRR